MRTFLVFLSLILFLIVSLPVYLLLFLFRKKYRHATSVIAQKIVKYAFKFVLFFAGTKIIAKGLENVPKDKAVLFVSNHRGFFDIILITVCIQERGVSAWREICGGILPTRGRRTCFIPWSLEVNTRGALTLSALLCGAPVILAL